MEMKGGWTQRALLKGRIDKGRHYDVEMKGWMENVHYDVQMNRADGKGRAL